MKRQSSLAAMSLALVGAAMVSQFGVTMVTPALPQIAQDLRISVRTTQIVVISYLVGYALSMLTSGLLADRYGARRVQVWGLILFTASSLVCATAGSVSLMTAARFLQGLGGSSATVLTE